MNTPWYEQQLAVFDTETTGVDPTTARIVTAHLSTDPPEKPGVLLDLIVNPGVPIPAAASAVHGVTDEVAARRGMDPPHALRVLANAITWCHRSGVPLVIMNAPYDLTVLRAECERHGVEFPPLPQILDPLVLDKAVDTYRRGKRTLTRLAEVYGVDLGDDAHEAAADAVAGGAVVRAIARRYPNIAGMTLGELQDAQVSWHAEQARSLASYFARQGMTDKAASVDERWPVR